MRVILISVAGIRPHLDEVRVEPYVFPVTMTFPDEDGNDVEHTFNSPEELEQFLEDVGLQSYVTDVGEAEETNTGLVRACKAALDYFRSTRHGREWTQNGGVEAELLDQALAAVREPQYRYFLYNYDEESIVGGASLVETFGSAAEAAESIEPQMTNVMVKRFEL